MATRVVYIQGKKKAVCLDKKHYHFEWDPHKATRNQSKHGVTFEQACEVFRDPMALTLYDDEHSGSGEDRWVTLGQVNGHHYLVVAHTYHNQDSDRVTLRIISARPATQREIRDYEQG